MLQGIIQGKQIKPRRTLLYGTHGIGKSTWASQAPKPLFIQVEEGLDDIGCDRTPMLRSTSDVGRYLVELGGDGEHPYKTVVIDTIDWLERLIWESVCEKENKSSINHIEDFGYGKGYTKAIPKWEWLLRALDGCRDRGMNVILLAHAKVEKFSPPDGDPYDRWQLDIHKAASQLVQEWADEVLFANYVVRTVSKDEGYNKKRTRAIGDGERIVHTSEHPTHVAKRRIELPETLPLAWAEYERHWLNGSVPSQNITGIVKEGHSKPKGEQL